MRPGIAPVPSSTIYSCEYFVILVPTNVPARERRQCFALVHSFVSQKDRLDRQSGSYVQMGRMQSLPRFPRYLCLSSGAENQRGAKIIGVGLWCPPLVAHVAMATAAMETAARGRRCSVFMHFRTIACVLVWSRAIHTLGVVYHRHCDALALS